MGHLPASPNSVGPSLTSPSRPEVAHLLISVGNVQIPALVDSGSVFSLIGDKLRLSLPSLSHRRCTPLSHRASSVTGHELDILGSLPIDFCSHSQQFSFPFRVVRGIHPPFILGCDFLYTHGAIIDMRACCMTIGDSVFPFMSTNDLTPISFAASVHEGIVVPASSEMILPIPVSSDYPLPFDAPLEGVLEPVTDSPIIVACSVACVEDGIIPVRVVNPTSSPISLYAGMLLGEFHPILGRPAEHYCAVSHQSSPPPSPPSPHVSFDPASFDLSSSPLSPSQLASVQALLLDYADIFSRTSDDYGRTDLVQHSIPTGDASPIRQRAYRASPVIRDEIKHQCDRLLKAGVIEPSSSPWSSPVVMVKKKTGGYRFCVDYRRLNKVTCPDSHPLPRIDDTIDALAGNCFFSTMDLSSGYWQVGMHPDDMPKTAFTTGSDLFHFKVMPMGLRNAPSTFQRLMQLVLRGLHWESVLVYLDDVIVFGRTFEDKLRCLGEVFGRLRTANLKLRPEKCFFFQKKVTFLGHVVSSEGVLPDPGNIAKVRDWPTPRNVTEVRAFLGLASYYRRFVKNFARVAQPLSFLTNKGVPFVWSEECAQAFNVLKHTLITPPLMAFPIFSQPFFLHTDASNAAVGAVLTQRLNGLEQVIAYASHSLSKTERRWSTYDRELYAIVWAVRHFKHYLLATPFTIITDHKPLVGLRKLPITHDNSGRRSRWALELDPFDWVIEHKEGAKHANADALSRIPDPELDVAATIQKMDVLAPISSGYPVGLPSTAPPSPLLSPPSAILSPTQDSIPSSLHSPQECVDFASPCDSSDLCSLLVKDGFRLHQAQRQDPCLQEVISWIRSRQPPPQSSLPSSDLTLRKYHSDLSSFVMQDGLLCRVSDPSSDPPVQRVVIPKSLVPHVLPLLHGSPLSGHFGAAKAIEKANKLCYWKGMRRDITDFCTRCVQCQERRNPTPTLKAPLQPIPSSRPFQRIAADLTELPLTANGNRYVLVVMDYFTKYVNLFPLPDQKACTVADCLFDKFVRQHGIPESLHTDQGRQFEAQVIQTLCQRMGIRKTRTTPYHPQSDGMVERFNRTLKRELGKRLSEAGSSWDHILGQVELSYNTTPHSSTGYTPFFLVHGREARLPLSILSPPTSLPSPDDYANNLLRRIDFAFDAASTHACHARQSQKKYYDSKTRFTPYKQDDLVWMSDPTMSRNKLAAQWKGPYRVVSADDKGILYHLSNPSSPSSPVQVIHYNRLKPYLPPPAPPSPPTSVGHSEAPSPSPPSQDPQPSTNIWTIPPTAPDIMFPEPVTKPPDIDFDLPPPTPSSDGHARNHDPCVRTRSGRTITPPNYYGCPVSY